MSSDSVSGVSEVSDVSDVAGSDEATTLLLVVPGLEFMTTSSDVDASWGSSVGWDEGNVDDDKEGGEQDDVTVSVFGGVSSLVLM